jgi:predicted DNA-binding transcriptional regulator YafY
MTYQSSANPQPTGRRVNPYALVHRSGWWYMVAYCHLRQAVRTFRVDRIQELELLNHTFQLPEDFDIRAYLDAEFQEQPVIRARLRFAPEAAHLASANLTGRESAHPNPDGSVDVTLAAPDLNWLASMALSFATWVTVLEPPELRSLVREWALETANLYQDESKHRKEDSNS